jgi:hypothetical protein
MDTKEMTIHSAADAKQYWNSNRSHKAKLATWIRHDGLYVLKDDTGRTIGAVTPSGALLNQNELLSYRIIAASA